MSVSSPFFQKNYPPVTKEAGANEAGAKEKIQELMKALDTAKKAFSYMMDYKWQLQNDINDLEGKTDKKSIQCKAHHEKELKEIQNAMLNLNFEKIIYDSTEELKVLKSSMVCAP